MEYLLYAEISFPISIIPKAVKMVKRLIVKGAKFLSDLISPFVKKG